MPNESEQTSDLPQPKGKPPTMRKSLVMDNMQTSALKPIRVVKLPTIENIENYTQLILDS